MDPEEEEKVNEGENIHGRESEIKQLNRTSSEKSGINEVSKACIADSILQLADPEPDAQGSKININ